MSSNNPRNWTPSGVCSPTQPNSFPPHVPLVQRQFDCKDQGPRKPENTKEVGYFCEWDNGEQLGPNILCHLTIGGQTTVHRLMDGKRLFLPAPPGEYEAQLLQDVSTEKKLNEARQQLQKALDAIIEHEKEEAAALKKIQDGQHAAIRATYLLLAMARGFGNSGVEFVKSTKELSDLVNPMTPLKNALASAWNAKRTDGTSWTQSFLQNYSNEQKRELAEVLGFHPDDISREQLAEAYNTACFIYDDTDSRNILKKFAATYIEVQNIQEKMEFTGSILFEIVLNILLAALTGGAGNAARIAVSAPLLKLLKPLKEALENLAKWIVNHTVKSGSRVEGMTGTGAVPVILRRPKEIVPDENSGQPEFGPDPRQNNKPPPEIEDTVDPREISGETTHTATGKQVHKTQANLRRESGLFDTVEQPIKDKRGNPILVPKRVDLKTGEALPDTPFQKAIPDAVSFDRALIVDDKPMGRPIAKDRQEIIRFINAYEKREGRLPEVIAIQRYDPDTGLPVKTDLYSPHDFLPN